MRGIVELCPGRKNQETVGDTSGETSLDAGWFGFVTSGP